jgi:hypothetical protein
MTIQLTWREASAQLKQGDRVVFIEPFDIFPVVRIKAGTAGIVEENNLNEAHCVLSIRPDDETISDLLADWDGCIYLGENLRPGTTNDGWQDVSPIARVAG